MPAYTQAQRQLRVRTELGEDVLLLGGFRGRERVDEPYVFTLSLYSERDDIEPDELLRTPVLVEMLLPGGETRKLHGLVRRFVQLDQAEGLTAYRAEVVPWLWFLSLSRDCRIFQGMSVPEIVETVFTDLGWSDFRFRTVRSYPSREYCVQYRESHLDFVSRLLEEEGLFYFFHHSDAGHELIVTDSVSTAAQCPDGGKARMALQAAPDEDVVNALLREGSVHPGKMSLRDYDYHQPSLNLACSMEGEEPEEVYDYPGGYSEREQGERYARLRLEREESMRHVVRGEGTCRAFQAGCTFELDHHYHRDANRGYLLLEVDHEARAPGYRAADPETFDYANRFVAVPDDVPYRPPRKTGKPVVAGSQTAEVVGKAGEEVWTDSRGRIKVQFHWDRLGKRDEKSSCWVRVATPWGGKGYGSLSIPRIGNEVVVEFLEGDPDRPLVVGSVYNDDDVPPYGLPGSGITMGMKSRSSPGGGGHNEISMTDTKGQEKITIHGQYDMNTTVGNDQTLSVGNDRSVSVGADERIEIGSDRTTSVGANERVDVGASRQENVGKDEKITIGGNRTERVSGDEQVGVAGKRKETVDGDDQLSVGGNRSSTAGKNMVLDAGKETSVTAGDEISLQAGSASLILKKDGTITLQGKDIVLKASGKIDVKASSTVTVKGSKIKQN